MILRNLYEALFGERHSEQPSKNTNEMSHLTPITIVPSQFNDDVERLKDYVGAEYWKSGLVIELHLQELLSICPRDRKRSDAYKKLIDYLADEQNITLIIKSKGGNKDGQTTKN